MPWERVVSVIESNGQYTCVTKSGARVRLRALPPEDKAGVETLEEAERIRESSRLDEMYFELRPTEKIVFGDGYGVFSKIMASGFPGFVRVRKRSSEVVFGYDVDN